MSSKAPSGLGGDDQHTPGKEYLPSLPGPGGSDIPGEILSPKGDCFNQRGCLCHSIGVKQTFGGLDQGKDGNRLRWLHLLDDGLHPLHILCPLAFGKDDGIRACREDHPQVIFPVNVKGVDAYHDLGFPEINVLNGHGHQDTGRVLLLRRYRVLQVQDHGVGSEEWPLLDHPRFVSGNIDA